MFAFQSKTRAQKQTVATYILFVDKPFDFLLPHEQHEYQEPLHAVANVRDVEHPSDVVHGPRDHLQGPGHTHHDEQPQVQAEPKMKINTTLGLVCKAIISVYQRNWIEL